MASTLAAQWTQEVVLEGPPLSLSLFFQLSPVSFPFVSLKGAARAQVCD